MNAQLDEQPVIVTRSMILDTLQEAVDDIKEGRSWDAMQSLIDLIADLEDV